MGKPYQVNGKWYVSDDEDVPSGTAVSTITGKPVNASEYEIPNWATPVPENKLGELISNVPSSVYANVIEPAIDVAQAPITLLKGELPLVPKIGFQSVGRALKTAFPEQANLPYDEDVPDYADVVKEISEDIKQRVTNPIESTVKDPVGNALILADIAALTKAGFRAGKNAASKIKRPLKPSEVIPGKVASEPPKPPTEPPTIDIGDAELDEMGKLRKQERDLLNKSPALRRQIREISRTPGANDDMELRNLAAAAEATRRQLPSQTLTTPTLEASDVKNIKDVDGLLKYKERVEDVLKKEKNPEIAELWREKIREIDDELFKRNPPPEQIMSPEDRRRNPILDELSDEQNPLDRETPAIADDEYLPSNRPILDRDVPLRPDDEWEGPTLPGKERINQRAIEQLEAAKTPEYVWNEIWRRIGPSPRTVIEPTRPTVNKGWQWNQYRKDKKEYDEYVKKRKEWDDKANKIKEEIEQREDRDKGIPVYDPARIEDKKSSIEARARKRALYDVGGGVTFEETMMASGDEPPSKPKSPSQLAAERLARGRKLFDEQRSAEALKIIESRKAAGTHKDILVSDTGILMYDNGEPVKVLRGSKVADIFSTKAGQQGVDREAGAYFFTDNESIARSYAGRKGQGYLFEADLKMDNPLIVEGSGAMWYSIPFNRGKGPELLKTNEIVTYAKNNGYDGVIIKNIQDSGPANATLPPNEALSNVIVSLNQDNIKNIKTRKGGGEGEGGASGEGGPPSGPTDGSGGSQASGSDLSDSGMAPLQKGYKAPSELTPFKNIADDEEAVTALRDMFVQPTKKSTPVFDVGGGITYEAAGGDESYKRRMPKLPIMPGEKIKKMELEKVNPVMERDIQIKENETQNVLRRMNDLEAAIQTHNGSQAEFDAMSMESLALRKAYVDIKQQEMDLKIDHMYQQRPDWLQPSGNRDPQTGKMLPKVSIQYDKNSNSLIIEDNTKLDSTGAAKFYIAGGTDTGGTLTMSIYTQDIDPTNNTLDRSTLFNGGQLMTMFMYGFRRDTKRIADTYVKTNAYMYKKALDESRAARGVATTEPYTAEDFRNAAAGTWSGKEHLSRGFEIDTSAMEKSGSYIASPKATYSPRPGLIRYTPVTPNKPRKK